MNDNFKKQIESMEDLVEIGNLISESTELRERIAKYAKKPVDSQFEKEGHPIQMNFAKKSDTIYLLGEYKKHIKDKSSILEILYDAISQNLVTSAHSLEKSGLFCGLIEACSIKKLGFDITGDAEISDKDFLFKDKNSAILVSVSADKEGPFVDFFFNNSIPLTLLGHVTKGELRMDDTSFGYISDFIN